MTTAVLAKLKPYIQTAVEMKAAGCTWEAIGAEVKIPRLKDPAPWQIRAHFIHDCQPDFMDAYEFLRASLKAPDVMEARGALLDVMLDKKQLGASRVAAAKTLMAYHGEMHQKEEGRAPAGTPGKRVLDALGFKAGAVKDAETEPAE